MVVEPLDPETPPAGDGFRPIRGEFATYWKRGRIARECKCHIGRCWLVREDGKLRGYITLLADCLKVEKPLLEAENVQYRTFPAIKIGLLAVDKRAKGLGIELVKWAFTYIASTLAPRVGARFVTVDALFDPDSGYDTAPYYEKKFGFSSVDPATKPSAERPFTTMFYDLKTILDLIESQPKAK